LLGVCQYLATETGTKGEYIMLEIIEIFLPIGILVMCAYAIGYMSGSDAAREIYNPTVRKNDLK
tara:strand:+ start:543 stop:734 length:192 start_codon:yes stop_codon:yes gene_type:complete